MKEVTHYECELCHKVYDRYDEAVKCEKYHILPKEIHSFKHFPIAEDMCGMGYPRLITVLMEDGHFVWYQRMEK